jgi:hypothetical protein
MATVHEAYEASMLTAFHRDYPQDLVDRARLERADLAGQPDGEAAFLAFGRAMGGLSVREAGATYQKIFFWTLRAGHIRFPDEP